MPCIRACWREADLNSSVTLLLTEIFQLGLFENPYTDPDNAQRIVNAPRLRRPG